MKYTFTIVGIFCLFNVSSQVICKASADSGSGYTTILNAGLDIESPDCQHGDFGAHVTQVYDEKIDRNVFVFHSHIAEDNDRCQVQDRVRMEIKGGPNTDEELQHTLGSESFYRWKFRVDENFIGASTFNHIFQNKAKGGNDDSFPVLTITLRAEILELRHDGGDTGSDLGVVAEADLSAIRGRWIEVYCRQLHAENGALEFTLTDLATGRTILEYVNNNIDLWRTGATYNRPKWGMYRSKNNVLKDEEIRFSDFCISESDVSLCPTEVAEVRDTVPPSAPTNLVVSNVSMNLAELQWDPSTDEFGVTQYFVIQDGVTIDSSSTTSITLINLSPGTSYDFRIKAADEAGNISQESNSVTTTTDAADALPDIATLSFPEDGATGVDINPTLQWAIGNNTDSVSVFLGTENPPPFIGNQSTSFLEPELMPGTTYYWSIHAINENGETLSPVWTFSTGDENGDAPWQVYRATTRPEVESSIYELNRIPEVPAADEIINDANGSSNTYYAFWSENKEDFRWRHDFSPSDSVITIVARLQGINSDVNGIIYFEIRGNGWRQKIRINPSSIKLEKTSPEEEKDLPFDLINDMHLIRIISDGQFTAIYLDEDPEPFISGVSNTSSGNTYFEWGNSGGTNYGSIVDWIAIDKTAGHPPTEGAALPADLFLSSIATLSSIEIDGMSLNDFSPDRLEYNYDVSDNVVPTVTWKTTSNLAQVIKEDPSTVPNSQATLAVTAQDNLTKTTYIISYDGSTSLTEIESNPKVVLYPIPATDFMQVQLDANQKGRISITDAVGKIILSNILVNESDTINLRSLASGVYFLSIHLENQKVVTRKFVKKDN